ncbi:MAG: flippase [Rubricoccaceae bacterium]
MTRNALLATIERLVGGVGKIVIAIFVARFLGAEAQGVYATLLSVWAVVASWGTFGVEIANNYYGARVSENGGLSALLGNTLLFSLVTGGIAVACVLGLTHWTELLDIIPPDLRPALAVGALLMTLSFPVGGVLFGLGEFKVHLIGVIINTVGFMAAAFAALALNLLTVNILCWLWVASLGGMVVYWTGVILWKTRGRLRLSRDLFRNQIRYGLKGYVYNAFNVVNFRFDVLILGAFAPAAAVGYYSVAVSVAEGITYIPKGLTNVILTRVSSEGTHGTAIFQVLSTLLLASALAIAVVSPVVVPAVFSDDFVRSVLPLQIMLPGTYLLSLGIVAAYTLFGLDRGGSASLAAAVCAGLTLALDIALIPTLGIVGAALASSIAYSAFGVVALFELADRDVSGALSRLRPSLSMTWDVAGSLLRR